jgi:hypothetical protein
MKLIGLLVAISTLIAVPAFAKGGNKASFPMPAATFKQKVDRRVAKARQKMETHVSKLPADKQKEARARFDAGVARINQEVTKVTADGTVTKEEAAQVRQVAKDLKAKK